MRLLFLCLLAVFANAARHQRQQPPATLVNDANRTEEVAENNSTVEDTNSTATDDVVSDSAAPTGDSEKATEENPLATMVAQESPKVGITENLPAHPDAVNLKVEETQAAPKHEAAKVPNPDVSKESVATYEQTANEAYDAKFPEDSRPKVVRGGFARPMVFDQKLLVCNAYSHAKPAEIILNENATLSGEKGLAYKDCRYMEAAVKEGDRLDFNVEEGVGGTFEVSDLPKDNAVLLLILERRDTSSSLVAFQSFAFPSNSRDTAQVAVIDAYKGFPALLNMQDHVVTDAKASQRVRLEELDMNRVYAIEAGDYDADIEVASSSGEPEHVAKRTIQLKGGVDYVLLRTGTNDPNGQDLVVFPNGASHAALSVLVIAALAFLF